MMDQGKDMMGGCMSSQGAGHALHRERVPLGNLEKLSNLGWFLLHPANGLIGFALYAGKILAVRSMKVGWKTAGTLLGAGVFVFWLVQIATIVIGELAILKI